YKNINMLKKERQAYILQQINIHNKVLSSDLSVQMNVSEDTIRRDLQELDEQGKITKVHGGALSKAFHFTLQSNVVYQQTEKRMIAQKAIALLRDGMFILLSGGTTIVEMVKILPKELNVTFITVSLPVALELLNHPNCQVVFLGNLLSKNAQIAIGAEVVTRLNEITADICFLGTNSIDAEKGITDLEWEVIEVKKAMINSALKTVSLAISEKVNTVQRLQVCKLEAIHTLITELDSTDPRLAPYKEAGLQIL
ncbi:DeoR/GlpR family DNA-binding transcription regulator, partial [Hydrotalea sp.]|uniref:DeoR/GlpR family DNA-binding transcription regulator n=1 Tax=Hydrotalea sp. TaxID=2881279 RepID=UPI0026089465